jgi:hypothetical protein
LIASAREKETDDFVLAVVSSAGGLLAFGFAGGGFVSDRLAVVVAVPAGWHRGSWCTGAGGGNRLFASKSFAGHLSLQ